MLYIFILIFILLLFFFINKNYINLNYFEYFENNKPLFFNTDQYKDFIVKNYNKDKIFKLNIIKNKEDINECIKRCDFENCIKLKIMKENYDKCNSCQKDDTKCYNKLLYEGRCDPCGKNLEKVNCLDTNNFACPNLKDVYNINGSEPYYLQVLDDKNITSPYKQSCVFCWNLKNYL